MKRFEIGETVIALENGEIDPRIQPIQKGKSYTVQSIMFCPKCGIQIINVTNTPIHTPNTGKFDCLCGKESPFDSPYRMTASKYFARPQELEEEIKTEEKLENYERCHELKQLLHETNT